METQTVTAATRPAEGSGDWAAETSAATPEGTGPQARAVPLLLVPSLVVVAVVVCVGVQWAVTAIRLPADTNVPAAVSTWTVFSAVAALGALLIVQRIPFWLRAGLVVAVLTATATAVLAWPLHGTSYYFGGLWSDQQFRTQYLTRLADSPSLADMNYAGLPPFYPAAWFWLAGRAADLTGMAPWAAYKPVALATVGLTPALVWVVWSRIVGWRSAVGVAVVTLVASVSMAATEPYSWPVAALMPAAAVVFWREVSSSAPRRGRLLAVGLYGGAAAATYTLFGFAAALLVALLATLAVFQARGGRWAAVRRVAGCLVTAGLPALAVASVVWGPFLVADLRSHPEGNVAARFLPLVSADLPTVLGADPWGLLLGAGVVALLVRACRPWGRRPEVFLALLVTAAMTYGWYAANTIALAFGTTLLAFRFENLVVLVLGTAGVLLIPEALAWARVGLAARARQLGRPTVARLAMAAVALAALALTQVVDQRIQTLDDRVERAYATPYPSGENARGQTDPDREEGYSDALAAAIDDLTGTAEDRTVVLSTSYTLLSVHPYLGFQSLIPHYANPLADYEARARYIRDLAGSATTGDLASLLDDCPWEAPTVFVLRRHDDGLYLRLGSDAFPAAPNTSFTDVAFDPALFAQPQFRTVDVGPFVVAVRIS